MLNLQTLKTEITTDPAGLGYTGDDRQDAAILNNGTLREVPETVAIKDVLQFLSRQVDGSGASLRYTLDMIREYATAGTVRGASAGETGPEARRSAAQMILMMLQIGNDGVFQVDDTNIRNAFIAIGPDGGNGPSVLTSDQLTALAAIAKKQGSRAVELFGVSVTPSDVANARRA